ncbi:MAG: autotransporter outer membrane beta-barrel domain-containing protein [Pseudomonas sp.]
MARPHFRKTLLALAIATSQSLLAQTVTLTGQPAKLTPADYSIDWNEALLLTGHAIGSQYAVDIEAEFGNSLWDITNRASLSTSGDGSRALGLSAFNTPVAYIFGNLANEGQISANGNNSSGILVTGVVSINADLINAATINTSGDGSAGIRLSNGNAWNLNNSGSISASGARAAGILISEGFWLATGLNNSGAIQATGLQAKGISLSNSRLHSPWVNSGSIEVTGDSSSGISLEEGSRVSLVVNTADGLISATGDYSRGLSITPGRLEYGSSTLQNDGSIKVSGRESVGVLIDHPNNLGLIENSGEILAQGTNSRAIVIGNGAPNDPPRFPWNFSLSNLGTIRAEGVTIDVAETPAYIEDSYRWINIVQTGGLIEGGQAAIRGKGNIELLLWGGEIRGDLLGLGEMSARDGALFNGELIQSPILDVYSLELGQPHTRLEGDLYLVGPGELDLNLHTQTDPHRAILEVSGNALFGYDTQLRVKPVSEDFRGQPLREYVLLSAAQIRDPGAKYGVGLQVISLSDLLQIESYEITDTQVTAVIKSMSTAQAGDYLREHGAQPHLLPAFSAFYGSTLGNLSDEDPLFEATIRSNAEELVRLAQQLAPEVNGGAGQTAASNHNLLGNVLQGRSASLRQGLSSGDGLSETGAWVQVLDSDTDQGERNGIPGYDADSQGIAVGADGKLNAQTTLGLAYSYLTSDVRSQSGNKTDIDGHALTLYSGFEQDAWFADASLTYGKSGNQSKRYIAGTRAEGDYDSALWGLNLLGGYGFDLGRGLLLEPRLAARYSNVAIDGFREKGSSAALAAGSQRFEVGELGAGVRLAGRFGAGQGSLEPEAKLMAYHDFIADQTSSTSSFVVGGTPFVTHGAKPARDSYEASVGATYHLGAVSLGLSYDYLTKADFSADTVQARFRYDF